MPLTVIVAAAVFRFLRAFRGPGTFHYDQSCVNTYLSLKSFCLCSSPGCSEFSLLPGTRRIQGVRPLKGEVRSYFVCDTWIDASPRTGNCGDAGAKIGPEGEDGLCFVFGCACPSTSLPSTIGEAGGGGMLPQPLP